MTLINEKQYFSESEKVIQIVKEREADLHRSLPVDRRLQIAKESLDKAKTREEYDHINKLIKDFEFELKFGKDYIPAIPEEYQLKIAYNRVQEEEELESAIQQEKETLVQILDGLESSLMNTLANIESLEKRKLIGKKIDILLDGNIQKDNRFSSSSWHANYLATSGEHDNAKKAREKGSKLFDALRKIATEPSTPTGIGKPSIFKKLLGGKE